MPRTRKTAPKLPKHVFSVLGPMPVTLTPDLLEEHDAFGRVGFVRRQIEIDSTGSPDVAWSTLWHEIVHVALWDGGVHNVLQESVHEAVCDALGTYLAAAQKAGWLTVTAK